MAHDTIPRVAPAAPRVAVLVHDRALAAVVPEGGREVAVRALTAPLRTVSRGPLATPSAEPDDCLGLLVLDGLLVRSVSVERAGSIEILGQGDVIRPWIEDVDDELLKVGTSWEVLERARLALLDRAFVQRAAGWPEVLSALYGRAVDRAYRLAAYTAIGHVRRVDDRLLALFWRLAGRWGRVTPDGLLVPLPLTHQTLARLVGAQRPSVTTAITRLIRGGRLTRRADGTWILRGAPPPPTTVDADAAVNGSRNAPLAPA